MRVNVERSGARDADRCPEDDIAEVMLFFGET
jgi:hypothetical protein